MAGLKKIWKGGKKNSFPLFLGFNVREPQPAPEPVPVSQGNPSKFTYIPPITHQSLLRENT